MPPTPLPASSAATLPRGKSPPGCERTVAARNNARCLRCKNGATQTNEGRFNTVDRMAAACNRACIAALEARGTLAEKFENPFRQSPTWSRDLLGNTIS